MNTEYSEKLFAEKITTGMASKDELFMAECMRLATLETYLRGRLHGQDFAIRDVCEIFKRGELFDFPDDARPKGSMIFMGPSGVGKTELVKLVAGYLFSDDPDLRRPIFFDMVNYNHDEAVSVFLGDKNSPGQLGEALKTHKKGILLFDEFEKAHPQIMIQFMNILDEGRIKCNNGELFQLHNYYIILTSNLGSAEFKESAGAKYMILKQTAFQAIAAHTKHELAERINKIVVFLDLTMEAKVRVCRDMTKKVLMQYEKKNIFLKAHENVISEFLQKGADNERGMRLMRNVIDSLIGNVVSDICIEKQIQSFHGLLYAEGGAIRISLLPENDPVFQAPEIFIQASSSCMPLLNSL